MSGSACSACLLLHSLLAWGSVCLDTMPRETLPTIDELNQMDDLTGATLYRAEVRQIPFLTGDEQGTVIAAARAGDREAQHRLVCNCLNWTMRRAGVIYRNQA